MRANSTSENLHINGKSIVNHFVGAFFPDKASRLYEQKASAALVIV
jgi:hypothetical protein